MKLPEKYIAEKKIQIWVIPIFILFAIVGVIYNQDQWMKIIYASVMCYFSFIFFHLFYLGIKYSFAHLSIGIYPKEQYAAKYYLSLCFYFIAGCGGVYIALNS